MTPLLAVAEIVGSLLPTLLILHQALHQVRVVFELGVHHLNVLVVFPEESSQSGKGTSDFFPQNPDGFALVLGDSPEESLGF